MCWGRRLFTRRLLSPQISSTPDVREPTGSSCQKNRVTSCEDHQECVLFRINMAAMASVLNNRSKSHHIRPNYLNCPFKTRVSSSGQTRTLDYSGTSAAPDFTSCWSKIIHQFNLTFKLKYKRERAACLWWGWTQSSVHVSSRNLFLKQVSNSAAGIRITSLP